MPGPALCLTTSVMRPEVREVEGTADTHEHRGLGQRVRLDAGAELVRVYHATRPLDDER